MVGPNIYEADVIATAAFAMGPKGIQFVSDKDLDGFMSTEDQQNVPPPGFKRHVDKV